MIELNELVNTFLKQALRLIVFHQITLLGNLCQKPSLELLHSLIHVHTIRGQKCSLFHFIIVPLK